MGKGSGTACREALVIGEAKASGPLAELEDYIGDKGAAPRHRDLAKLRHPDFYKALEKVRKDWREEMTKGNFENGITQTLISYLDMDKQYQREAVKAMQKLRKQGLVTLHKRRWYPSGSSLLNLAAKDIDCLSLLKEYHQEHKQWPNLAQIVKVMRQESLESFDDHILDYHYQGASLKPNQQQVLTWRVGVYTNQHPVYTSINEKHLKSLAGKGVAKENPDGSWQAVGG